MPKKVTKVLGKMPSATIMDKDVDLNDGEGDNEIDQNEDDIDIDEDIDVDVDVDDDEGDDDDKGKSKKNKDDEEDDDDDDEEDDDDDDDDDNESVTMPKKRTHVYHQIPESTEIKISLPQNRITSEYMTVYEYSMIVGTRASHIANGAVLYTNPEGLYDPREIAKKEITENKCPLSVTRQISSTTMEIWEVNEMIKPLV